MDGYAQNDPFVEQILKLDLPPVPQTEEGKPAPMDEDSDDSISIDEALLLEMYGDDTSDMDLDIQLSEYYDFESEAMTSPSAMAGSVTTDENSVAAYEWEMAGSVTTDEISVAAYTWDRNFEYRPEWRVYLSASIESETTKSPKARISILKGGLQKLAQAHAELARLIVINDGTAEIRIGADEAYRRVVYRRNLGRDYDKDRSIFEKLHLFGENFYQLMRFPVETLIAELANHTEALSKITDLKEIVPVLQEIFIQVFSNERMIDDRVEALESDVRGLRVDVDEMKAADAAEYDDTYLDGERPFKVRRMRDLAAYRAIRPSALSGDRKWCLPGKVVGIYSDGAGPLLASELPECYMVITSTPSMIEAAQFNVPLEDQIKVVQLGECPILLHDVGEYAKFYEKDSYCYAYVSKCTEIRLCWSRKTPNIFACVFKHQLKDETSLLPEFQGVKGGIRACVNSFDRPPIDVKKEMEKKKNKKPKKVSEKIAQALNFWLGTRIGKPPRKEKTDDKSKKPEIKSHDNRPTSDTTGVKNGAFKKPSPKSDAFSKPGGKK